MISKDTLELIGKTTALAAFLFGVASWAWDQMQSRERMRYEAATNLIERYRTDGVRESEATLDQRMLYYRTGGRDPNDPADWPDRLFDAVAKDVLFGFTDDPDRTAVPLLPEIFRIADFYGEVGFCVAQGMCARDVLKGFFCPRARQTAQSNARVMDYYSDYSSSGEWKDGMDAFLEMCS